MRDPYDMALRESHLQQSKLYNSAAQEVARLTVVQIDNNGFADADSAEAYAKYYLDGHPDYGYPELVGVIRDAMEKTKEAGLRKAAEIVEDWYVQRDLPWWFEKESEEMEAAILALIKTGDAS